MVKLDEKIDDALPSHLGSEKKQELLQEVRKELDEPVKIIGAGQSGVGKSTLMRSIFEISEDDSDIPVWLTSSATSAETEEFRSHTIETEEGFKIKFTDGPGLGESIENDKEYRPQWAEQIQDHDLFYWVLDASARGTMSAVQKNLKYLIQETGYDDRMVVVMNKVDQIQLPRDEREKYGGDQWNEEYNLPTDRLEEQIEKRADDIKEKLHSHTGLSKEQMIACSALKRWRNDKVLDKFVEHLPPADRVKMLANRDVNDFTELMSEEAKRKLE
jgi:predicted GTPase